MSTCEISTVAMWAPPAITFVFWLLAASDALSARRQREEAWASLQEAQKLLDEDANPLLSPPQKTET